MEAECFDGLHPANPGQIMKNANKDYIRQTGGRCGKPSQSKDWPNLYSILSSSGSLMYWRHSWLLTSPGEFDSLKTHSLPAMSELGVVYLVR